MKKESGLGCGIAFATPFALAGLLTLAKGLQLASSEGFGESTFTALAAGSVFAGVGFGIMVALVYGLKLAREEERRRARYPEEPWRWDVRWNDGRILCDGKARQVAMWAFAGIWNGISLPTALLFLRDEGFEASTPEPYLVMLFPAIGLGLLVAAIRGTLRWLRFGRSELVLPAMTGVIGGHLQGSLETRAPLHSAERVTLTLNCLERRTRRRGKNTETDERVLWQEVQELRPPRSSHGSRGGAETALPFGFTIPADCRATDGEDHSNRILWRLEVEAAIPGIDYAATFEPPVFLTEDSVDDPQPLDTPGLQVDDTPVDPAAHGIQIRPSGANGLVIHFEAMRNKGAMFSLGFFILLWTGAIWLGHYYGAPIFFAVVFAFFEILMIVAWISMAFSTRRVEVRNGRVTIRSSTLGIGHSEELDGSSIEAVRLEVGMTSRSGSKHTPYWDIQLHPKVGRDFTAGRSIRDKAVAQHVADALSHALGLPETGTTTD